MKNSDIYKFNLEKTANMILGTIQSYTKLKISSTDRAFINTAVELLLEHYEKKFRQDGQPAIIHPLTVALKCISYYKIYDKEMVIAALLHDIVEDSSLSADEIKTLFGSNIAFLVDGLTKLSYEDNVDLPKMIKDASSLFKLLIFAEKDIRIILIKFVDRIDNLESILATPEVQRQIKSKETSDIYIPLADALNIWKVKMKFENLTFKIENQKLANIFYSEFKALKDRLFKNQTPENYININVKKKIEQEFRKNKIRVMKIKYREKSLYSIRKKMSEDGIPLEEIHDLFGLKFIFDTEPECYNALARIKKLFPDHIREKDYIKTPKDNGYRSLHLSIFEPKAKFYLEIQIKTDEMEAHNEYGPAAHPKYKGWNFDPGEINAFSKIYDMLEGVMYSKQYNKGSSQVQVFTPAGDKILLPYGSTVLDLAFKIHTDLFFHCTGAVIERRAQKTIVPFNEILEGGDSVEINIDSDTHPAINWLLFVRTPGAFKALKDWIYQYYGYDEILKILNQDLMHIEDSKIVPPIYAIIKSIYKNIYPTDLKKIKKTPAEKELLLESTYKLINPQTKEEIYSYHNSICCSPLFGEDIVGLKKKDIYEIHKRNCKNMAKKKIITLNWAQSMDIKKWNTKIYFSLKKPMGRKKLSPLIDKLISSNLKNYEGHYEDLRIDYNDESNINGKRTFVESGYIIFKVNTMKVVEIITNALLNDGNFSDVLPTCL